MIVKTRYSGNRYGFRIPPSAREAWFSGMTEIILFLPDEHEGKRINLPPSFWEDCNHIDHKDIRSWLEKRGKLFWPTNYPYKFELVHLDDNRFQIQDVF